MPSKGLSRDLEYQHKRYKKAGTKEKARYIRKLRQRDGDNCWLCGEFVPYVSEMNSPTGQSIDHVVSPKQGGAVWDARNMKLAHRRCNSARHPGNENVCK